MKIRKGPIVFSHLLVAFVSGISLLFLKWIIIETGYDVKPDSYWIFWIVCLGVLHGDFSHSIAETEADKR